MKVCEYCGGQREATKEPCPHCGQGGVRVLTRQEGRSFDGETIDVGGEGETKRERSYGSAAGNHGSRVYVRQYSLSSGGWWWKAFLGLAVLGAVFFFLLPLFLVLTALSVLGWLWLRWRR